MRRPSKPGNPCVLRRHCTRGSFPSALWISIRSGGRATHCQTRSRWGQDFDRWLGLRPIRLPRRTDSGPSESQGRCRFSGHCSARRHRETIGIDLKIRQSVAVAIARRTTSRSMPPPAIRAPRSTGRQVWFAFGDGWCGVACRPAVSSEWTRMPIQNGLLPGSKWPWRPSAPTVRQ